MTQSRMIMLWGVWLSLIIVAPVAALVPPIPLAATTWTLALTSSSSSSFSLLPLATTTAMWIADNKNDMELAELPPPYVPALFGVALLVGVGVLTGSLGNVMDEEASLGMQSGARAKKEIERSRSSYFKQK